MRNRSETFAVLMGIARCEQKEGIMTALIIYETVAVIALVCMGIMEMTQSQARLELRSSPVRERK